MPSAGVLGEVQRWMEADLARRRSDRAERIAAEERAPRRALAARALEAARKELGTMDSLLLGASRLEWLIARWPRTEAGEKAVELLADLRADPRRGKTLALQSATRQRGFLTMQARALENVGRMEEARIAWERVASLSEAEERTKADNQVKRLQALVARTPYLGVSFAGDTTSIKAVTPGGPAHRAGLRKGDRLEQMGKVRVASAADARDQLLACKPGDELLLTVRREDKPMSLTVKVGSPPAKEEAAAR